MRTTARSIFDAGLTAADPSVAVRAALADAPVQAERIVAVGKAALAMLAAAREHLPDAPALAVTNRENAALADGAHVLVAGHPVPNAEGEVAARRVEAFVADAREGETVLVLVSGGASAMLPAPIDGVTLADKVAVTGTLLASGVPIDDTNVVRRALSRLKGGGLARAIHPARTVALLLSDVPRDDIAVIASGPTVPQGTAAEVSGAAIDVLRRYALAERVPASVTDVLRKRAGTEGPFAVRDRRVDDDPAVENRLVGGNGPSLDAMAARCLADGLPHSIVTRWLDGDVADAAAAMHRAALEAPDGTLALLAGGETTVVLRGDGVGGRNQELALRFAMLAEGAPLGRQWAFLSGGTDGRDGPTEAAGGLVDAGTVPAIRAAGIDPVEALRRNDSGTALAAGGGLLVTGPTGTNVADLQVLVLGPRDITAP